MPMSGLLAGSVIALAAAAIVLVLILTRRRRRDSAFEAVTASKESAPAPTAGAPSHQGKQRPCPLCGRLLAPGERVHSTVRLTPAGERIMEIAGCPQCRPPASYGRKCPVCKTSLGPQDIVTARVFDRSRENKKPHVHVLGCTRCRH